MGYTADLNTLTMRLKGLHLYETAEAMRQGTLNEPLVVTVASSKDVDKVKHLIYSWFRHHHIAGAYHIKWHSAISILIEPALNKDNIIGRKGV